MILLQKKPKRDLHTGYIKQRRRLSGKTISALQLYSLCAIPVLLVLLFNYIPMFGIVIAFKNYNYTDGILGSKWVGFDNFRFFFETDVFWRIARNTVGMNVLFIFSGLIAKLAFAIMLFEITSRRFVKTVQTISIMPNFLSMVIVAYIVYAILNPRYGSLNKIFGLNIDWYTKPNAWPVILTITNVWKNVGIGSVIYYASLMGIDTQYFEAAELDGATKWDKIRFIMIPSLMKLIVMLTILDVGGIFNADFGMFYQVTRNSSTLYPTTDVISTYTFRALTEMGNTSMGSAVGLLQNVVGLIMVMITNYAAKKIDPDYGLF